MPLAPIAGAQTSMEILPLTGNLGAEIRGIDIRQLDDATFNQLRDAFHQFGVLVIRDQTLTHSDQVDFAKRFGKPEVHPIVEGINQHPEIIKVHKAAGDSATFGVGWHSDNSFVQSPSLGSILYAEKVPPVGGDTLFANQYLALEQLSDGMQRMLAGLNAVHSAKYAYTAPTTRTKYEGKTTIAYRYSDVVQSEVIHPVVRIHPATKRKALYINPMFTVSLENMTEQESRPLLEFLFRHAAREDFQCRVRWQVGTVTMWDNRCVQHTALNDCHGHERVLYRVTIQGE